MSAGALTERGWRQVWALVDDEDADDMDADGQWVLLATAVFQVAGALDGTNPTPTREAVFEVVRMGSIAQLKSYLREHATP